MNKKSIFLWISAHELIQLFT